MTKVPVQLLVPVIVKGATPKRAHLGSPHNTTKDLGKMCLLLAFNQ